MQTSQAPQVDPQVQWMTQLNALLLRTVHARTQDELAFTILNDTVRVLRYDRASLWTFDSSGKPRLYGVSGQTSAERKTALAQSWQRVIKRLPDVESLTLVEPELLTDVELPDDSQVLWLPLQVDGDLVLGLWVEVWLASQRPLPPDEQLKLIGNLLLPGYAEAWVKLSPHFSLLRWGLSRSKLLAGGAAALLALLLGVQVPLRVVAPCEIVADKPVVVTAPLSGIIEEIVVEPGATVAAGDLLFRYDARAPLQELEAARKQVEISRAQLRRATSIGLQDRETRGEVAIADLELERGRLELAYAEQQAQQLEVSAPNAGVADIEQPELWHGKPVEVGERVLSLYDPQQTKLRLWIPESDHLAFSQEEPISVVLNVDPSSRYTARLTYVTPRSGVDERNQVSFVADADWELAPSEDLRVGLKGSAILYGEDVSLGYYLIRRPWTSLRYLLGL